MRCLNIQYQIQRFFAVNSSNPSAPISAMEKVAKHAVWHVRTTFPSLGSRPRLPRRLMNLNALANESLLRSPSAISRSSNLSHHQPQLVITFTPTIKELQVNIISRPMIGNQTSIRRPYPCLGLVRDAGLGMRGREAGSGFGSGKAGAHAGQP